MIRIDFRFVWAISQVHREWHVYFKCKAILSRQTNNFISCEATANSVSNEYEMPH